MSLLIIVIGLALIFVVRRTPIMKLISIIVKTYLIIIIILSVFIAIVFFQGGAP